MLKTLKIKNFQSHKETELNFSKGVNVIAGQSDSGKTAILRALKWLLSNKPTGDSFRSHWGGDTEVKAEFEDGFVTRGRHKKNDNFYNWHLDEKPFKAFGTNIPDQITEFLNMDQVNTQGQLHPPFLLSSTPGEVAKFLNKVANLDLIDHATYNINSKHTSIEGEIKNLEKTKDDLRDKWSRYETFDDLDKLLKDTEKLNDKYTQGEKDLRTLEHLIKYWEEIENEYKEVENYVKLEGIVEKCIETRENIHYVTDCYETLEKFESDINKRDRYIELEELVDKCLNLSAVKDEISETYGLFPIIWRDINELEQEIELEKEVKEALDYGDSFVEKKEYLAEFKKAVTYAQKLKTDITDIVRHLEKDEDKLKAEMPEICPLCEQPVNMEKGNE